MASLSGETFTQGSLAATVCAGVVACLLAAILATVLIPRHDPELGAVAAG